MIQMLISIFLLPISFINCWPIVDSSIRGLYLLNSLASKSICNEYNSDNYSKICAKCKDIAKYEYDLTLKTFESEISKYALNTIVKNVLRENSYFNISKYQLNIEINKLLLILIEKHGFNENSTQTLINNTKNFLDAADKFIKDRLAYEKNYIKESTITTLHMRMYKILNLYNAYASMGLITLADIVGVNACETISKMVNDICMELYSKYTKESGNSTDGSTSNPKSKNSEINEMNIISNILLSQAKEIEAINEDDIFEISKQINNDILRKTISGITNLLHIDLKTSLQIFVKELNV